MRILVTGGGGFLGTEIIKELLKDPANKVTNFSRQKYTHLSEMNVPTIQGDLRKRDELEKALLFGFDAIIHTAAKAGIWGSYKDFLEINFEGTKNLVELAQKVGIPKMVYTSTPSVVFGEEDLAGADESTPIPEKHLCHYAATKAMAEKLVLQSNSKDFSTCAIRPHLIWGPGDPHLFPRVISRGRLGKLKIVGDGQNLVDIIFVENAARAHVQALMKLDRFSPVAGQAYFIGQEKPVKLWDFINDILTYAGIERVEDMISLKKAYAIGKAMEWVWNVAGIQSPEPPMTRFVALNLGKSHYFSHAKAKKDFGYEPLVSIEEGMRRYFKLRDDRKKILGIKN